MWGGIKKKKNLNQSRSFCFYSEKSSCSSLNTSLKKTFQAFGFCLAITINRWWLFHRLGHLVSSQPNINKRPLHDCIGHSDPETKPRLGVKEKRSEREELSSLILAVSSFQEKRWRGTGEKQIQYLNRNMPLAQMIRVQHSWNQCFWAKISQSWIKPQSWPFNWILQTR